MIDRVLDRIIEDDGLVFRLLRRLLYGRKLRETIAELKAKGDLRLEGLRRSTLIFPLVHTLCFAGIVLSTSYLWKHWHALPLSNALILAIFSGAFAVIEIIGWQHLRGSTLVLIATGSITNGLISFAEYWAPRGGWSMHYYFKDNNNIVHKSRKKIGHLLENETEPKKGDRIFVIFEKKIQENLCHTFHQNFGGTVLNGRDTMRWLENRL